MEDFLWKNSLKLNLSKTQIRAVSEVQLIKDFVYKSKDMTRVE